MAKKRPRRIAMGEDATNRASRAMMRFCASPFRYLRKRCLVVLIYVRFRLSLRNVEDLLHERGIDLCHETLRLWWTDLALFAANIRRQRVSWMRGFRHWQWHTDEVHVKINGETHHLWHAVDHEGEILEGYVTKTRDEPAILRFRRRERAMLRFRQMKSLQKVRLRPRLLSQPF